MARSRTYKKKRRIRHSKSLTLKGGWLPASHATIGGAEEYVAPIPIPIQFPGVSQATVLPPPPTQAGGGDVTTDLLNNADAPNVNVGTIMDFVVKFQPTIKADTAGNMLTVYQTAHEPHCIWMNDKSLYTVICWDPDVPVNKSFLHWLVVDCSGGDATAGNVLSSWIAPSPPPGSGVHRYIIALFKQAGPSNGMNVVDRTNFNAGIYAQQNNLTPMSYRGFRIEATKAS